MPGSGTTLVSEMSGFTVMVRVSFTGAVVAGVVEFAVSTTWTVSVLGPAATVVAPLSQVSVVAAGVQVIHPGMAGVVNTLPPIPPATV